MSDNKRKELIALLEKCASDDELRAACLLVEEICCCDECPRLVPEAELKYKNQQYLCSECLDKQLR